MVTSCMLKHLDWPLTEPVSWYGSIQLHTSSQVHRVGTAWLVSKSCNPVCRDNVFKDEGSSQPLAIVSRS